MRRALVGPIVGALVAIAVVACALPSRDEFAAGDADASPDSAVVANGDASTDTGTPVDSGADACAASPCQVCESGACQTVVTTQRAEVSCTSTATLCNTGALATTTATAGGLAGHDYLVTYRVRGVVEEKSYPGGTTLGPHVQRGGNPNSDGRNVARLEVSVPQATFFLNAASSPVGYSATVDTTFDVKVTSGATLTLTLDPLDAKQLQNAGMSGAPIVIPDIPPAPASFDGQFLQLDVVAVVPD